MWQFSYRLCEGLAIPHSNYLYHVIYNISNHCKMFNSSLSKDNAIRPETNLARLYAKWQTEHPANLDECWPMRLFFSDGTARVFYPPLNFKLQGGANCSVVQHLANSVRYQGQYNPSWTGILSSCFALTSRSKRQILRYEWNYVTCEVQCVVTVLFCTDIRTSLFIRKLVFNLRKKRYKLLYFEHSFVRSWNFDA